jgi:hypothetical protein
MNRRSILIFMCSLLAVAVAVWSVGPALAAPKDKGVSINDHAKKFGKKSPAEVKAAAKRARDIGLLPGVAGFDARQIEPGAAQTKGPKAK